MFKGITTTGKFLIIHDEVYLTVQTPQDYGSPKRIMKALSGTSIHTFRENLDATHLSSFQANQHGVHIKHYFQIQLADSKVKQIFNKDLAVPATSRPFRATGVLHGCSSTAN